MSKLTFLPVAAALLLAGCNDRTSQPLPPAPTASGWTIQHSRNVPLQMFQSGATYYVDLPNSDGLHYVVRTPEAVAGKTITMKFSIVGDGAVLPTQGEPPARIRLFLQQRGDTMTAGEEDKRWWSLANAELVGPGEYELSAKVEPEFWSNVFGKNGSTSPAGFATCVNNLWAIGWTCGGMFAGHGIYTTGAARLVLHSFTIT